MPRSLPDRPNLEYLRKEAKDLLKAQRAGEQTVCDTLRQLHRFAQASDTEILAADLSLHEAQSALARDYGFASWPQLTANVAAMIRQPDQDRRSRQVVIPGVPHANFDIHWDMPVRAMGALLHFRGIGANSDELLAISGDAFALCHASHWQGTAYLGTPTNPIRNLAEGYGFHYDSTHAGPTGPLIHRQSLDERLALTGKVLQQLHAEIDAGRPVLVAGAEAHCGSMSLIVGYDQDRTWLCHVGDGRPYRWTPLRGVAEEAVNHGLGVMDGRCRGTVTPGFVGGWQANPVYLIGERTVEIDTHEQISRALALAVMLHHAPKAYRRNWGGVDYYFGAEAYRQWADALDELDYPADLAGPFTTNGVEDAYDWYTMSNMDMQVDQIITGRTAAAAFCQQAAGRLGGSAASALDQAAQAYTDEVDLARTAFAVFIPRFEDHDESRRAWFSDRQRCARGAATIRTLLEYENTAVQALEQVLQHLA